ncbi:RNA methyltransferase [Promethearchaeum syntrophicum]|uniref:RNA methyltransferase n=1 Tax=Promethearchaeum syntrophicum TaxID=2594042 RepID=A0A5B9D6B5_9ARCH|nr:TrmJ/YjtD family RNA methyltransferase [Candidatus Prometheoarchaeum syntrophicum]QEE14572.1 putative RNA methyltransferase [Candidatus Prometheoarchaeum syntrophicum]
MNERKDFINNEKIISDALDLSIILVNVESSGNVGSVARVMKNFGFHKLILFNPKEEPKSKYAYGFAMHAQEILENAQVIYTDNQEGPEGLKFLLQKFDLVIGTSAKGIVRKNLKRIPIFLNELDFSLFTKKSKVALVFGRESTGLTNNEIQLMDFLLRIPADYDYPTLNISQAVGIILYSFYLKSHQIGRQEISLATKGKRDLLLKHINDTINYIPMQKFRTERTLQSFKNFLGRAFLSEKESSYLLHFFQKVNLAIENPSLFKKNIKK